MAYQDRTADRSPPPEYLARKGDGPMAKDDIRAVVSSALAQSVQFVDTELSDERAQATNYYLGKPFGNEEEGRSQVVLTEVRDAVDGMLPSLLRVFFGSEHVVEFVPTNPSQVEQAAQATDYIRYLFEEENGGFLKTLCVLKDGMVRKIGVFKWAWDETSETKAYRIEGIDPQQVELLAADDAVEISALEERPDGLRNVDLTRKTEGKVRVWDLPPEEFVFNREARSLDEALIRAHRTDKTRGELLAMGISAKDIDEHAGAGSGSTDASLQGNAEAIARRDIAGVGRSAGFGYTTDPEMGPANAKILYTEALMHIDVDGDGVAELRRVCCIGPTHYPVSWEPADDTMGFAAFSPYPEPHTLLGGSVADRTMDMQRITSSLLRGTLDSLSAAIFPRTAYSEGNVSVADIMNTAIGAPIRVRGDVNAAIRPIEVPFTGKDAIPLVAMMQEIIERRTGRNKGTAGLDADALQSTGKEAVGAVLSGSQEQLEMIARVFAETTLKPLFKGLLRVVRARQQRKRMIRLRGSWVEIDPSVWDADMDVTVNIGLGTTFVDKKVATLMAVAADQKEIAAATGGIYSPVVPLPKIMGTRQKILSLQGIKDFGTYYNADVLQVGWQPPPPPPTPPDPTTMAIHAEHEMNRLKVIKELTIEQDKLKAQAENDEREFWFKVKQHADDVALKRLEIEAKYTFDANQADLDRAAVQEVKETELTLAAHDQITGHALERDRFAHDQAMDRRAADTADAALTVSTDSEGAE